MIYAILFLTALPVLGLVALVAIAGVTRRPIRISKLLVDFPERSIDVSIKTDRSQANENGAELALNDGNHHLADYDADKTSGEQALKQISNR